MLLRLPLLEGIFPWWRLGSSSCCSCDLQDPDGDPNAAMFIITSLIGYAGFNISVALAVGVVSRDAEAGCGFMFS